MPEALTSTDFYSGVGGWSVGLKMAGIEVLRSYESWNPANNTNRNNNKHAVTECDIRQLDALDVPTTAIIVGSPPCTQFSLSNRGGSGDTSEGLKDVAAFLAIVKRSKPRWWVMENVPRVAPIVARELLPGGQLHEFHDLKLESRIFDMAAFGLPQRRRRCLIGNIDFDLLASYAEVLPQRTLGDVVGAFSTGVLVDPIYGVERPIEDVSDHLVEQPLNIEEQRINCALKALHPVYNSMSFPDRLDRPARTITATCTRVSRESIIVPAPERQSSFRRLTIRERAMAQGFPITFEFFGRTYAQKIRMIGNALPPLFAFYVGHAIKGTPANLLPAPADAYPKVTRSNTRARPIAPKSPAFKYPANRRFRFAVPSLRMKSGMRFELTNGPAPRVDWHLLFVFGTPKEIRRIRADKALLFSFGPSLPDQLWRQVLEELSVFEDYLRTVDIRHLQAVWSHTGPGSTRPFMLLDEISRAGERLTSLIEPFGSAIQRLAAEKLGGANAEKAKAHATRILAGLIIASVTNDHLSIGPKPLPNRMDSPERERFTA